MKPTMKQIAYLSALADRLHVRAPRVRTRGEATAAIADMKDRLAQRSFRFTPARRGGPDPDVVGAGGPDAGGFEKEE